jgi:RND family efflux transporter MFP subunit
MSPLEESRVDAPAHPKNSLPVHSDCGGRGSATTLKVALGVMALVALLGTLFVAGLLPRLRRESRLSIEVQEARDRLPDARVIAVKKSSAESTITLPGTARAWLEAPLYARVNGYLKRFHVDIGDPVKKGQLIAEIESPEIDQQLRQARANLAVAQAALAQTQANLDLAKVGARRYGTLAKEHAVSQQEADEKQSALSAREADVQAAKAAILAQEANVKRLEELQTFEQIVAPFEGTLISRTVDVGTLVSEGSSAGTRELFRVAQVGSLRVFVHLPEALLASVHEGLVARIRFDAWPGREFRGTVSRTAHAIDPSSRTMLTELSVANAEGLLISGQYAQVTLELKHSAPPLLMPSNALILRSEEPHAARVDEDGTVHYLPVKVGRDYGMQIEVLSGINEGDYIMINPTTDLREGQKVRPLHEK